jgi:hypothetical protein
VHVLELAQPDVDAGGGIADIEHVRGIGSARFAASMSEAARARLRIH